MKSKICFWFIFGSRQQLKKSFAHSTQLMRICWVAGYLVCQKWRILIHTKYTKSACMWGRHEDFPDVPVGLGAQVYACCLDIIMGTVYFQLKSALVWNVNYMWHACVREEQTYGNSAAQWFMSGVQGNRHRERKKRGKSCKGSEDIQESDGETRNMRTAEAVPSLYRDCRRINKRGQNISCVTEKWGLSEHC